MIAEKYRLWVADVNAILDRHGVPISEKPQKLVGVVKPRKYNHAIVIADYQSGLSVPDIMQKHDMPFRRTLYHILERHDVPRNRPKGPESLSMKPWNPDFFKSDTAEVAYWCGFLMADGNIRQDRPGQNTWVLSLAIHVKDIDHLRSFCNAIGLDRSFIEIQKQRKTTMARVMVYHPSLPDTLRKWGVIPNKTKQFVKPQVSDALLPHYLRGWADGDGYIMWSQSRDRLDTRFAVTGQHDAMRWYRKALKRLGFSGKAYIKHRAGKCWARLHVHATDGILEIARLLLAKDSFRLERKWDKVLSYV